VASFLANLGVEPVIPQEDDGHKTNLVERLEITPMWLLPSYFSLEMKSGIPEKSRRNPGLGQSEGHL